MIINVAILGPTIVKRRGLYDKIVLHCIESKSIKTAIFISILVYSLFKLCSAAARGKLAKLISNL